jgi:hypothetical protein
MVSECADPCRSSSSVSWQNHPDFIKVVLAGGRTSCDAGKDKDMQQPNLASEVSIPILDTNLIRKGISVAIISVDGDPGIGNTVVVQQGSVRNRH